MKYRTVTKVVKEQVPWERKDAQPIFPINHINEDYPGKGDYVTLKKGAKLVICVANEEADALEHYEVELLDDICVNLMENAHTKVLSKLEDDPL